MSSSSSSSSSSAGHNQKLNNDYLLAQELERREKERRRCEEQREFDQLRAQFGMDNDGNFHTQVQFMYLFVVWRLDVNRDVSTNVQGITPYYGVR